MLLAGYGQDGAKACAVKVRAIFETFTAYAEVFTVMEYLVSRRGSGVIRELLGHVRDGHGPFEAIEETVGEPFAAFEQNWMGYMRGRPRGEIPRDFLDEIQLMPEEESDASVDRFAGITVNDSGGRRIVSTHHPNVRRGHT